MNKRYKYHSVKILNQNSMCDSDEEINTCDGCNIELDRIRDGSTDKNFRSSRK